MLLLRTSRVLHYPEYNNSASTKIDSYDSSAQTALRFLHCCLLKSASIDSNDHRRTRKKLTHLPDNVDGVAKSGYHTCRVESLTAVLRVHRVVGLLLCLLCSDTINTTVTLQTVLYY